MSHLCCYFCSLLLLQLRLHFHFHVVVCWSVLIYHCLMCLRLRLSCLMSGHCILIHLSQFHSPLRWRYADVAIVGFGAIQCPGHCCCYHHQFCVVFSGIRVILHTGLSVGVRYDVTAVEVFTYVRLSLYPIHTITLIRICLTRVSKMATVFISPGSTSYLSMFPHFCLTIPRTCHAPC